MTARRIDGSWWVDLRSADRRYRVRSPDNHRDGALRYEAYLRGRLAEGKRIDRQSLEVEAGSKTILSEFAEEWMTSYVKTNLRASTARRYDLFLRHHLLPKFGSERLGEIGALAIEKYKAQRLRQGASPKSVNGELSTLHKCLDTARDWGLVKEVPRIKWLKVPPASFDFLSYVESAALFKAATEEPWRLMIHTALRTGMRRGELLSLQWNDVDLERALITVRRSRTRQVEGPPKNNRIRHLPISRDLAAALEHAPRGASPYVFLLNGQPTPEATAAFAISRIGRPVIGRRVYWQMLRHTFASQLASASVPIQVIQSLMGHSTIQMTMRYAHLLPSAFGGVVDLLAAAELRELGQPVGRNREQEANTRYPKT